MPDDVDALEALRVVRPDGTGFTVSLARAADVDAPVVLVVPAMSMRARWYEAFLRALAAAGYHAAVTELRGHEARDPLRADRAHDWGYAELVADVGAAVDALAAAGLERPVLLGHSLGGHLVAAYAGCGHAQRVRGLAFVAAGSIHWRIWGRRRLLMMQLVPVLSSTLGYFPGERLRFAGREARTEMRDWARFGRTGRLVFGRPRVDHGAGLRDLTLPVLAVSFAGDALAPPASVDGLAGLLPAAALTRVHLDPAARGISGVDHLRWARVPESVVPELSAWLDALG